MKIAVLAFFLALYSSNLFAVGQCFETCGTNADCTGQCKYCPGTPDGCTNCCDFPSQEDCEIPDSPCTWTSGECRNVVGLPCSAGVSEINKNTPKSIWIILALFVSVIVPSLMIWKNRPKLTK